MTVSVYSVSTIAASLLLAQKNFFSDDQVTPTVPVTPDGAFLSEWYADDGSPPCKFYNASYQYKDGLCSHFSLARMSHATQSTAMDRAMQCAVHFETDCILSPEIGLSVPAAFVYDTQNGLKMITAPKIVELTGVYVEVKNIAISDPTGTRTGKQTRLNDTIRVEYLDMAERKMKSDVMYNSSAYCLQLLRFAFDDVCWSKID